MISLINAFFVGIFGSILSASFCDIKWTNKKKYTYMAVMIGLMAIQGVIFVLAGNSTVRELYPIITHLPLVIVLSLLSRRVLWSTVAVLTAYACCQLRRWVALFTVAIFSGGDTMQKAAEIIVTIPMLYLIIKYVSPSVRDMSNNTFKIQLQFTLLPTVLYAFDYITRVYTNWLEEGILAAVEFMPFVSSAMYLFFVLKINRDLRRQAELEQAHTVLDLQVKQADLNIKSMKKSQADAAEYRHDLRHHLQYISSCIEEGSLNEAQEYIKSLNDEITNQAVKKYCENTFVNLVLSSFAKRAEDNGINFTAKVKIEELVRISENDFCVLLSNAMENAVNAAVKVKKEGRKAFIEVRVYTKEDRVFLEIVNSCLDDVVFENELPITKENGHGIGIRSICAVVEKYGGLQNFEAKNGKFIFRMSL